MAALTNPYLDRLGLQRVPDAAGEPFAREGAIIEQLKRRAALFSPAQARH